MSSQAHLLQAITHSSQKDSNLNMVLHVLPWFDLTRLSTVRYTSKVQCKAAIWMRSAASTVPIHDLNQHVSKRAVSFTWFWKIYLYTIRFKLHYTWPLVVCELFQCQGAFYSPLPLALPSLFPQSFLLHWALLHKPTGICVSCSTTMQLLLCQKCSTSLRSFF